MGAQPTEQEKMFANLASDKELLSKMYFKNSYNSTIKIDK